MNKSYRTVWNEVLGAWVAVSEATRTRGKRSRCAVLAGAALLAATSAAQAQNVTLTGANGVLGGDICNSVYVPFECTPSETTAPLAPFSVASWNHLAPTIPPRPGVLIGANLSNSNSGPAVTGSATVTAGGTVNAGRLWVGFEANTTGSLSISGSGSRWTAGGIGVIGHYGTGSLTITDGGYLRSTNNYVAIYATSVGTVLISGIAADGTRSRWEGTNNTLYLGGGFVAPVSRPGGNGTVTIEDGGWSTSTGGGLRVGQALGGVGVMTVRGVHANGTASSFTTTGPTYVGNFGTGTLNIENGGLVSNSSAAIGGGAVTTDTSPAGVVTSVTPTMGVGTVNVAGIHANGTRSTWTNTGALTIGNYGTGTLNVTDGGLVSNTGGIIGNIAGSTGAATVSGVNGANRSTWTNSSLTVGASGAGTLSVTDGGLVTGATGSVGTAASSTSTATVSGVNGTNRSTWTNSGSLSVGSAGTGTLNVLDGGLVTSGIGTLGNTAGSTGTATVSGVNGTDRSTWTSSGNLSVGYNGTGVLNVTAGGQVTATGGLMTSYGPTASSTMTVSGAGSKVSTDGIATIGNQGESRVTVTDGGAVSAGQWTIVGNSGQGTVDIDNGGTWTSTSEFAVGHNTVGTVNILAGGSVASGLGRLGRYVDGIGTVNVQGTGASWTNAGALTLGDAGAGTLNLGDGGKVSSTNVVLGNQASGSGTVNLGAAAGSPAAAAGTLDTPTLAFGAGTGTLNFNHTGTGYEFNVAMSGGGLGNSTINQLAGVTNLTGNSSTFGGTTNVTGGRLSVNGTLGNATSQVNVGNGATLGGAGTIGGNVAIGNGVLSPGNSPGTLTINGNLALASGSVLDYELGAANTAGGPLNDLTVVKGNLTLDGTLNVTQSAGGVYGAGVYRLIDYTGTLTDNGLELGSMPAGTDNYVQTSIANQVNLVNSQGLTLNWWDGDAGGRNDGAIAGGNGSWTAIGSGATADRWTQADGLVNAPYQNGAFAIFAGAPGTVTVDNGAGQVRVSGMQFATSGYRIEGGPVELTAGTNAIRVGDGTGAGAATSATIASALTGAGQLDKVDLGTLVLTGANSYSGGTTVSGGTLQLGDGGTSGSITGNVSNNATLAFNRSDASSFAGSISGTGQVLQAGSGSTTLSGTNTYSGGTTISAGTLIGSATSFGSGAITDNAALVIEQAGDATMANAINGSGSLTKTGAGTLTYSGSGTLSGPTTVAQGTLAVNGSLANSAVAVASGATLAGTGTVGASSIAAGGSVAPGAGGIGTLTVNGNFSQAAGSMYQVQVQGGSNHSDLVNVLGSASVAGATLNVARTGIGSYGLDTRYTVLSASGGVSGTYASLTGDTRSAFVQLRDSYDANHVYLTAEQYRSFSNAGGTRNQIATGLGLDSLPAGSALANAIAWLPSDLAARAAFDQLSGEIHASVQTATVEDSRFVREAALARLRASACAPGASGTLQQTDRPAERPAAGGAGCSPEGSERVLWGQVFGAWGHFKGDGNAAGADRDIGGFFVGADSGLGGGWRAGGLGGISRSTLDTEGRGSARTTSYHLGLYGGNQWGNTALRLGAAYAWNKVDTARSVAFSGFADSLNARYDSRTAQVFAEVGQRIDVGAAALEPFAQLAYVSVKSDAFSERGGLAALHGGAGSVSSSFATLGVRGSLALSDKSRLTGTLGWRHAFGDTVPERTQAFLGGSPFTVGGVPLARNVAVLEAGIDSELTPGLTLSATYSGQLASRVRDHGVKLNLRWKF